VASLLVISAMIAAAVDITADWLDQAEKRVIRFAIKSLRPEPLSSARPGKHGEAGALSRSHCRRYGHDRRPRLQSVQIVGPLLHHYPSLFQEPCTVVGGAQSVRYRMGKLMFNDFGFDE